MAGGGVLMLLLLLLLATPGTAISLECSHSDPVVDIDGLQVVHHGILQNSTNVLFVRPHDWIASVIVLVLGDSGVNTTLLFPLHTPCFPHATDWWKLVVHCIQMKKAMDVQCLLTVGDCTMMCYKKFTSNCVVGVVVIGLGNSHWRLTPPPATCSVTEPATVEHQPFLLPCKDQDFFDFLQSFLSNLTIPASLTCSHQTPNCSVADVVLDAGNVTLVDQKSLQGRRSQSLLLLLQIDVGFKGVSVKVDGIHGTTDMWFPYKARCFRKIKHWLAVKVFCTKSGQESIDCVMRAGECHWSCLQQNTSPDLVKLRVVAHGTSKWKRFSYTAPPQKCGITWWAYKGMNGEAVCPAKDTSLPMTVVVVVVLVVVVVMLVTTVVTTAKICEIRRRRVPQSSFETHLTSHTLAAQPTTQPSTSWPPAHEEEAIYDTINDMDIYLEPKPAPTVYANCVVRETHNRM